MKKALAAGAKPRKIRGPKETKSIASFYYLDYIIYVNSIKGFTG